jgi:hypothetical protein
MSYDNDEYYKIRTTNGLVPPLLKDTSLMEIERHNLITFII